MALFVLALGVLMACAGAYEIYYGSGYISIERGWSAYISGFVLLTGGLVTIALGVAIRALTSLKTALIGVRAGVAHESAVVIPSAVPEPRLDIPTYEFAADEPAANPSAIVTDEQPAGMLLDTLKPDPVPPAPRRKTVAPKIPRLPIAEVAETAPLAFDHREPHDKSPRDLDLVDEPTVAPEPLGRAGETHVADDIEPSVEPPPALDDWLDRRFADLDREVSDRYSPPAPEHTGALDPFEHEHAEPQPDTSTAEPADVAADSEHLTRPEPPHSVEVSADHTERPASATEAESSDPAASPVIGRYESEGTSYVMYADGSIEAQSEAGVYRFASMAELKSFIEG